MTDFERYAHAAQIIADMKAAGGWDLTGWEMHFAELPPEIVHTLPDLADGHIRAKVDNIWFDMGAALNLSISQENDYSEIAIPGMPFLYRELRGPRSVEFEFSVAYSPSVAKFIQEHLERARGDMDFHIGVEGKVLAGNLVFREAHWNRDEIRIKAAASGEVTIT